MTKDEAVKSAYELLRKAEQEGAPVSLLEIENATGWSTATVKTYFSKKWKRFLTPAGDSTFAVSGIAKLNFHSFLQLQSQKFVTENEILRPRYGSLVDELIDKSRDSALLSVCIFNNPLMRFRSHGFIVQLNIAWTALFHAIFERDGIDYYHTDKAGNYIHIDGQKKAWELEKCANEYWKGQSCAPKENLLFLNALRNQIEHRFLPAIDFEVWGHCQACLNNFEDVLVREFGEYFGLLTSLAVPLQLSKLASEAHINALKELQSENYTLVRKYIQSYHSKVSDDIFSSQNFQIKVFVVPVLANHARSADVALKFVKLDESDPAAKEFYEKNFAHVFIKEKHTDQTPYTLRPSIVVEKVGRKLGKKFTPDTHTRAWKHFNVRPPSKATTRDTKKEYCGYLDGPGQYYYTETWVDFLVKELSDDSTYETVLKYR